MLAPRALAQPPAAPDITGVANFVVLLRGTRVGTTSTSISSSGSGWLLESTSRLDPPIDLVTSKFEVRYGADWQPQQLAIESTLGGQQLSLSTNFGVTTAMSELTQAGQHGSNSVQISPRTIVLPNNFFGAYEALAIRLSSLAAGARVPLFIAPAGEVTATVARVAPTRVTRPEGPVDLRAFTLSVPGQSGPSEIDLWIDARGRLARVSLPAVALVMIRDDLASVSAREEPVHNPGDKETFFPSNGFSLAGTITRPSNAAGKHPAVVLVASPGPQDRDYSTYGVSIFGQLAGALAAHGAVVVRYDGRGVGQSGGRPESAGVPEYAEDAIGIVDWLKDQDDVDRDRIVVVGYGDAGPIALTAARREKQIDGVVLIAAPGRNGRDVTLDTQRRLLARLTLPDADKAARVALQTRIIDATLTGKGWDGIPDDVRRQSDTVWFKNWLQFDPADVIAKLQQPLLIIQGALDTETAPSAADDLASLSAARKKQPASDTSKVVVPGVNHLLVAATTGDIDEYVSLPSRTIAPGVVDAITGWLDRTLPAK
ncbi:MAG TPA: alpha/beta hydrolase [Vicinamibacterales bacterium]|nr:alpha/beta hydrolase [Vicinamibacterales bacterium]